MSDLYPTPAVIRRGDPTSHWTGSLRTSRDPSIPPQGYELIVDRRGAHLRHADDAGRRYGEHTVAQLRLEDGSLPEVTIRDRPDLPVRGYMLDISRDRVPTRATLRRLVWLLATARYNHLQLYVEHTFAYRDHTEVWGDASPLTLADLRWLDDLCTAHGIELAANQNCFGHMGRWLAVDRYRPMADSPDGVEILPGVRLPPSVLAPTQANAEFAIGLVREQMEALTTRIVNVGCDETFELGRGVSAARAAEIGADGVYLEHLVRIVEPLLADGLAVQVWGDVLAHHADRLRELPEGDLTTLVWNYDAPGIETPPLPTEVVATLRNLGIDLETPTDFETRLAPFLESGLTSWVAPGTSTWNSLVGRWDNARANLLDAAVTGRDHRIEGYLVTDWGDNGHHHPPSVSDLPILYGGAVAWCAEANADLDVAAVADRLVYDDPNARIGPVLESVGTVWARTGRVARNVSPLVAALFPHQLHLIGGAADPELVAEVILSLDRSRDDLAGARPAAVDGETVLEEIDVSIGLARHAAVRLGSSVGLPSPGPTAMRAELGRLIDRYRATWATRSRPGGLPDSVAHLQRTLESDDAG